MVVEYPAAESTSLSITYKSGGVSLLSYTAPADTNTARNKFTQELAASASLVAVDLAGYCNTLTEFYVKNASTGGVLLLAAKRNGLGSAPANNNNSLVIRGGGVQIITWDAAELPPIIYLSNPDATDSILVEVGLTGEFTPDP